MERLIPSRRRASFSFHSHWWIKINLTGWQTEAKNWEWKFSSKSGRWCPFKSVRTGKDEYLRRFYSGKFSVYHRPFHLHSDRLNWKFWPNRKCPRSDLHCVRLKTIRVVNVVVETIYDLPVFGDWSTLDASETRSINHLKILKYVKILCNKIRRHVFGPHHSKCPQNLQLINVEVYQSLRRSFLPTKLLNPLTE